MNRTDLERDYWDNAALDPDVDQKYISDISTKECIKALEIPCDSENILEIGCGVGRITSELAKQEIVIDEFDSYEQGGTFYRYSVYGMDISKNMIKIAERRDKDTIYWRCDDLTQYADIWFDFVYSILVFQHLKADTIQNYMRETYRVLEPGGIFRFQFIEGDEDEPFSNHYELNQMKAWVEESGLEFIKADKGLCHYQWTWITARKP